MLRKAKGIPNSFQLGFVNRLNLVPPASILTDAWGLAASTMDCPNDLQTLHAPTIVMKPGICIRESHTINRR